MTVASKQKKLEKRVEASKSLSHFDKMRFNMAIKKSLNIKTLKDVEEEIGETIAKKLSEKRSEEMKIQWTMRDPLLEGGRAFTERKKEHMEYLQRFTELDVPSVAASETDVVGYRKKFRDFINKSTLLNLEDKKEFLVKVDAKNPNWTGIKNDIKIRARENERFIAKKREIIKNIESSENLKPEQQKMFIESITKAPTSKRVSQIEGKIISTAATEKKKDKEALKKMLEDIKEEKAFVEIPEVKKSEKVPTKEPAVIPIKKPAVILAPAIPIEKLPKVEKPEIVTRKPEVVKAKPFVSAADELKVVEFKKTLAKVIRENPHLTPEYRKEALKDLETGDIEPKVLREQVSIEIERGKKVGKVIVKPSLRPPARLPLREKGYVGIKVTDVTSENYINILAKEGTDLDKRRWREYKQVNIDLAKRVRPKPEEKVLPVKLPVRDEKIVFMDVSKGIARTDIGRKIQIKREVWDEYKKKDKIEKYDVKSGLGITKSGKKVSLITLLKEPHKLEDKITAIALRRKLPKMVKATYFKDGKLVTEYVVAGDSKLKEIGAIKRAKIKPLTEEEMHRIRETGVRQRQMLMEAAELYQDQLRAQKFLASAFKGKIKPFPKKGYSTYKIMAAYRKRKPPWRLHIRRDHHRDEVHMKFVCTNDYLRGREEVHKEVQKILTLMNMRMTPDATIRDVRPPRVGPKYRWIHIAVKAKKIGEGEIRPRR